MLKYDKQCVRRIFCYHILMEIVFYELIFLKQFYGFVMGGWSLDILYYFIKEVSKVVIVYFIKFVKIKPV